MLCLISNCHSIAQYFMGESLDESDDLLANVYLSSNNIEQYYHTGFICKAQFLQTIDFLV